MDGVQYNSTLLALLGRTDGAAADRALLELLQSGSGAMQLVVMRELLGRSQALSVARRLPHLDTPARNALLAEPELSEPLARGGLNASDDATRLNVISLLVESNRPAQAYLLGAGVTDASEPVRRKAAEGIDTLVRTHLNDAEAVDRYVVPAVTAAMRTIGTHRQTGVMAAAVRLGARCPAEVFDLLDQPANRLTGLLAEALREIPPAEAADFIFLSLRRPYVGNVAKSYIGQATWPTLAALGTRSHWALLKPIRSQLAEILHLRSVAAEPACLGDLPEADQAGALRLVMATGASAKLRRTVLGEALSGSAVAAHEAMRYALDGPDSNADLILLALHSAHPDVQMAAAGRIVAGQVDQHVTQHLFGALADMAEPVRAVVGQFLAARSFEQYWHSFTKLDSEVAVRAGKALLKLDQCVSDLLACRLVGRDVSEQLQAIQMVRQLQAAGQYTTMLARLTRRGDRMVRSAAVAALAQTDGADVRSTLARCLDDADMRVQANAIEALAQVGGNPSAVLDKLDSHNNRVRANTVKWLLEADHPQGPMALATMLTDGRAAHQISALWVVRVLAYTPAITLLSRLAAEDPDVKVRARMATVLRRLRRHVAEEALV